MLSLLAAVTIAFQAQSVADSSPFRASDHSIAQSVCSQLGSKGRQMT